MGAWFESILVRTEDADVVRQILVRAAEETGCKFFLGPPVRGWISFFPENNLGEMDDLMPEIARQLSYDIFRLAVHDDDDFVYHFYRAGNLLDQYNSCPSSFNEVSPEEETKLQGRPELFQELLTKPRSLQKLKALLQADHEKFIFESERLTEFVELLGLPNAIGSYDLLVDAQPDEAEEFDIQNWEAFVRIEPSADSKARHKKRIESEAAKNMGTSLASMHNTVGRANREAGDLDRALADFNRAIEIDPNFASAYSNRGLAKKNKGDLDGAMADFDKAIELDSTLAAAYGGRAQIKRLKSDPKGALVDFNKAIELKPDSATLHNNRAELKRTIRDLDGALMDYGKAIELKPAYAVAYSNRGLAKTSKGDLEGAMADFDKAIELNPNLAAAYYNRYRLRNRQGDREGASADFNRAVILNPAFAKDKTGSP